MAKMTRRVKADLPGRAQGAPGRSLAARSLILKLVSLRHGDKALCATQNLFFKRAAVEFVRRDERGLVAHREVEVA